MDRLQIDSETGLRRWCVACDFDETLADTAQLGTVDPKLSAQVVKVVLPGGGQG